MREILFRAKRIDDGSWVEGAYYIEPYTDKVFIIRWNSMGMGFNEFVEVAKDSVGQYTELKDIAGQRIFEGDVFVDDDNECVGVVSWYDGGFCIHWYGRDGLMMEYGYDECAGEFGLLESERCSDIYIDTLEVIGNIHDNPELIKENTNAHDS